MHFEVSHVVTFYQICNRKKSWYQIDLIGTKIIICCSSMQCCILASIHCLELPIHEVGYGVILFFLLLLTNMLCLIKELFLVDDIYIYM